MLIQQIIEFELREPLPLIVKHVLLNPVSFMTKKISKAYTRMIIYC